MPSAIWVGLGVSNQPRQMARGALNPACLSAADPDPWVSLSQQPLNLWGARPRP